MDRGSYLKPHGLSGGLALWCRKEVDIHVRCKNESMIDTTINLNDGSGTIGIVG